VIGLIWKKRRTHAGIKLSFPLVFPLLTMRGGAFTGPAAVSASSSSSSCGMVTRRGGEEFAAAVATVVPVGGMGRHDDAHAPVMCVVSVWCGGSREREGES